MMYLRTNEQKYSRNQEAFSDKMRGRSTNFLERMRRSSRQTGSLSRKLYILRVYSLREQKVVNRGVEQTEEEVRGKTS